MVSEDVGVSPICMAFFAGAVAAVMLALLGKPAVDAAIEVRFHVGARYRYSRGLPWADRPAIWRWVTGGARMWWHLFLFGGPETTTLTFKNGDEFVRRSFGRAERVR